MSFWVPPSWQAAAGEDLGVCTVHLYSPEMPRYGITLEVYRGSFPEIATRWSFERRGKVWYCVTDGFEAQAVSLPGRTKAQYCQFSFRAYSEQGGYAGVGDGEMAALELRHHALLIRGVAAGEYFHKVACSLRGPE